MSVRPILFALLRSGLNLEREAVGALSPLFDKTPDWKKIYLESLRQGVLAIAYDGLDRLIREGAIPAEKQPSRTMKLQWAYNVMQIEQRYAQQRHTAGELAEAYDREGIRTVVLKGIAVAQYYPREDHRPCGDLDCFLMGDYERGNRIAEELGAEIEDAGYKHSHMFYKNLTVENHQFCTPIRNGRRQKNFERTLQHLLEEYAPRPIGDSPLKTPSDLFNALFLTAHGWGHFLSEGITLRHWTDWIMLLDKAADGIDWRRFAEILRRCNRGLLSFAESLTRLSHRYFGTPLPEGLQLGEDLTAADERLLHSILYETDSIHNKGYSAWKVRALIVRNTLKSQWKYRDFSEYCSLRHLCKNTWAFFFERHPHL